MSAVTRLKEVKEPIDIIIPCHSRIKRWAFHNAYTLIFLSTMFVITWTLLLVVIYAR